MEQALFYLKTACKSAKRLHPPMRYQLYFCFMLSLIALAAAPVALAEELSAQDQASLEQERVWINTPAGKDLAFYISEKTGTAHGGVLILPNIGQHPATNGNIKTLRQQLAENHWHTLALHIEARESDTIQEKIAAGISLLNEKGIYNIAIVADGQSAAHALTYVAKLTPQTEGGIQQIRALIMIDAENYFPDQEDNPMTALATIKLPVLDAYTANDYRAQQFAADRKRYAGRQQSVYQQTRLPTISLNNPDKENRITKRIRGWLDNNIAGFMVNRN